MNTNQGIISLTKWITGASFVILAVGIMFVPSDEEKIRKMKERIKAMDNVDNKKKNQSTISEWLTGKPKTPSSTTPMTKNINQQAKESNEKTTNVNIFKEL
ncbi:hypothetical protein DERF_010704 [Dermatophagoides farinae]|uniref:Uncharacterized protein n=1 Tax=Dermatophagoides farinae TaxID=6954 RepID=A0A922HQT4_DERFA|nr:uncharacterized protein LOC124497799 [Dermatophagoides farinae]KAH7642966.1 hypothetical protein HUG17_9657 [Dermatophagoides farinae]KAH9505941.1 hypothetical protein DERF_010704 [Dermatophagoides farinae]